MRITRSATTALVLATGLVVSASAWAGNGQSTGGTQHTQPTQQTQKPETQKTETQKTQQGTLSARDKKFLDDAYNSASAELQIGQLAADKGSTDAVKNLGKKIVDDEQRQLADLKGIIDKHNLQVPTPEAKHTADVTRLSKLSGTQFDQAFLAHEQSSDRAMLSELDRESKSGQNADLKTYAGSQVAVLRSHIDQARSVGVAEKQGEPKGQTNKQPQQPQQQPKQQPQQQQQQQQNK